MKLATIKPSKDSGIRTIPLTVISQHRSLLQNPNLFTAPLPGNMSRHRAPGSFALGLFLTLFAATSSAEPAPEPDWPELDLQESITAVSDGELRLLPDKPPTGVHVHENQIRIRTESLADGWVVLDQCHEHLDQVPAAQITFNPKRVRNLRITSAVHIDRAWVEGHSVQLQDIQAGARLCLSTEIRAFLDLGHGYYRLRNGPYMRRFLDGYYPMRVLIDVQYPAQTLELVRSQPPAQPGLELRSEPGRLRIDASFEGRLYTCVDFRTEAAHERAVPEQSCDET